MPQAVTAILREIAGRADLLRREGLDQDAVLDAMEAGYLAPLVKLKRQMIETGEFPAQFKLSLAAKDFGLAADAALEAGVELRGLELSSRLLDQAAAAGLGDRDYAALIAFLDERAGGR